MKSNINLYQDVFRQSAETLHRMVGYPVSMWLPDSENTCFRIATAVGVQASYSQKAVISMSIPSVVGDVFLNKEPEIIPDISKEDRWQYKDDAARFGWEAVLCVPIISQEKSLGVISIYTTTNDAPLEKIKEQMRQHAYQIGLTIDATNRRLILEELLKINKKFDNISSKPMDVLQEIVKVACEVIGGDCAVLYPYDPNRDEFYDKEHVAAYGLNEDLSLTEKSRSSGGMTAFVRSMNELLVENIEQEYPKMFKSPFIQRESIKSFMAMSLGIDNQSVGVLFINFRAPRHFTNEDINTARLFASQAYNAIRNMRLYADSRRRAEAIKELHKTSLDLISVSQSKNHLQDVLNKIAEDARLVLRADLVDLYRYDSDRQMFILPPSLSGQRISPQVRHIHPDDVVYQLVEITTPRYVCNVKEQDSIFTKPFAEERTGAVTRERFVVRENIVSTAAIPLRIEGQPVGLLFANYRTEQTFPKHVKELLELFAAQASVAIANANLHEQTKQQANALRELNKVAADLVKLGEDIDNITGLMNEIAIGAQKVLGADLVDIYQYYQGRDEFPPEFLTQVGKRMLEVKKTRIYSDDVAYTIVKNGKPWYESNAQENPELNAPHEHHPDSPSQRFVIRENIRSMSAVPMKVGTETVGVLFASYHEKQTFSNSQKELIDLFAAQAAVAIRNVRLLLRQKALESFGEAITSTTNRLKEDEVLQLIHIHAKNVMDTSNMYIALYDNVSDSIRFGLAYKDGVQANLQSRKINHSKIGKTEHIILNEPYILQSTREEETKWFNTPGHQEFVKGMEAASWLGVRMSVQDKVLGVIATYHRSREHVYSNEDLVTLQTIANQAAITIDNARMYYDINRKLDTVVRFGENVNSGERLQEAEVCNLIYEQVNELMDSDSMYIGLYDDITDVVRFGLAYKNGTQIDVKTDPLWQPRKARRRETEEIIKKRKRILTQAEAKKWYAEPGRTSYTDKPLPSWLGVPISLGDQVLGVIAVYHPTKEYVYTSDDLFILQAIANQAGVALDNARRYYETEQNLRTLVEFSAELTSNIRMSRDELLELIHAKAGKFLDTKNMYIALCDQEDGRDIVRFDLVYNNGKRETWSSRPADIGRTGEIIKSGKPIFLPTRKSIEDWLQQHPDQKEVSTSNSWLGVPMIANGKVLGVIGVDHPEQELWYTGDHQEILQTLANFAAISLENSNLFNKTRIDLIASQQLATLGTAIAALQHRINNTLNIIGPNVKRLRKRINSQDPEIDEILGIIDRNTRYTSDLLTRIQEPLQEVESVSVDINAHLTDIFNARRKEWADDKTHYLVDARLELGENIPIIPLPAGQLAEVLSNLIDNAFRALDKSLKANSTDGGAILRVASCVDGATIKIRVIDNVPGGIPPSIRNKLFGKPVPSKTPNEGSGLGLWLSKLIMQRIGGDIYIEQSGMTGTTMLVEIPCSE